MSKVIAFAENIIPGQANPDIIADIERLLSHAKSGNLTAIAYCTVYRDTKGTGWAGNMGTRDALAATIAMLQHRYSAGLLDWEQ